MVSMFHRVPTIAISRIVPRWSKKSLLGMKYPASRMIGGSMNRKNRSGVRVVGALPEVKYSRNPIRIPMTTNRHDSVSSEQVWSQMQYHLHGIEAAYVMSKVPYKHFISYFLIKNQY